MHLCMCHACVLVLGKQEISCSVYICSDAARTSHVGREEKRMLVYKYNVHFQKSMVWICYKYDLMQQTKCSEKGGYNTQPSPRALRYWSTSIFHPPVLIRKNMILTYIESAHTTIS